jgi:predicted hydrocarbon binding protein
MAKTAEERYSSVMEFVGDFNHALLAPVEEVPAQGEIVAVPHYCYPNEWGLSSILAVEQVLGHDALEQILIVAELDEYLENYPPQNMKRAFPFDHFSRLWQAVYQVYGQRGASAVAKAAGAKIYEDGLQKFGIISKVGHAAFEAAPISTRHRIGLEFVARLFNNLSDQRVEVQEADDHWIYRITRCPICWGWQAEEPVCFAAVGVLQAAFNWMDGQQRRIVETECIAKGDEACVIRIDKASLPSS